MKITLLSKEQINNSIKDFPLLEKHLKERESSIFYQEYPEIIYYFGAMEGGELIGVAGFESIVFENEEYLYLSPLEVSKGYKRKGVATALLREVVDKADSTKRKGVILICKGDLVSFYSRNGFVVSSKFRQGNKNRFLMILESNNRIQVDQDYE